MPAIQPTRLKKQALELASKVGQPAIFTRELHALLVQYSDHTHRKGQGSEPKPLQNSYNVPPPVMRQVLHELSPIAQRYPDAILPLCDALWADSTYDLQLLAAHLLGQVPVDQPEPIIRRLQLWTHEGNDKQILDALLGVEVVRLFRYSPQAVLDLVSAWLASPDTSTQQIGLRALLPMISLGSERLPAVFRLLTPFVRMAAHLVRPDVIAVLHALARSSASETAFFLRQNLSAPNNPDTAWLIRQVLDDFPEEFQAGLKAAMKKAK